MLETLFDYTMEFNRSINHKDHGATTKAARMRYILSKAKISGANNAKVQRKRNRLTRFIIREDWDGLFNELEADLDAPNVEDVEVVDEAVVKALLVLDPDTDRSALHIICSAHPPLHVVQKVARACPEALSQMDKNGHTPLHCAAEWGASSAVVDFLIYKYPAAAGMTDLDGKTPLHLTCENCCYDAACDMGHLPFEKNCGADESQPQLVKGPLLPVIKALCKAAPKIPNIEDDEGISALEYAIMHDADVKVVKLLQKASSTAWKDEKKEKARRAQLTARANSQLKIPSSSYPDFMSKERQNKEIPHLSSKIDVCNFDQKMDALGCPDPFEDAARQAPKTAPANMSVPQYRRHLAHYLERSRGRSYVKVHDEGARNATDGPVVRSSNLALRPLQRMHGRAPKAA